VSPPTVVVEPLEELPDELDELLEDPLEELPDELLDELPEELEELPEEADAGAASPDPPEQAESSNNSASDAPHRKFTPDMINLFE